MLLGKNKHREDEKIVPMVIIRDPVHCEHKYGTSTGILENTFITNRLKQACGIPQR